MHRIFPRSENNVFCFRSLCDLTFRDPNKWKSINDNFSSFFDKSGEFIFIRHEDTLENLKGNINPCLYSGYKVHFNFADHTQTEVAWNSLIPLFFANQSIIKSIKFVIPALVFPKGKTYAKNNIDNTPTERAKEHKGTLDTWLTRRLGSTQLTFYIYCHENTPQEVANNATVENMDCPAYIHLLLEAEKILLLNGIKPTLPAFQPLGDTRLGTFTSMRRDALNGKFISYRDMHTLPPTSFVSDFLEQYRDASLKNLKRKLETLTEHMLKVDANISPLIMSFEAEILSLKKDFEETLIDKVLGEMLEDYLYLIRNVRTQEENTIYRQIINVLLIQVKGVITPEAKAIAIDTDRVMLTTSIVMMDTSFTKVSNASLRKIKWTSIEKELKEQESLIPNCSTTSSPAKK